MRELGYSDAAAGRRIGAVRPGGRFHAAPTIHSSGAGFGGTVTVALDGEPIE